MTSNFTHMCEVVEATQQTGASYSVKHPGAPTLKIQVTTVGLEDEEPSA